MLAIVLLGSISHISLPLVVTMYPSVYFVLFITSVEGILIYGSMIVIVKFYNKIDNIMQILFNVFCDYWKIIVSTGISNAFMSIFMM
ncbi:MAG: hypothetical protein H0X03_09830 [Nitrosopumilus sp.]|nr:hypothetical protein [Nitrosopumilus sp.]